MKNKSLFSLILIPLIFSGLFFSIWSLNEVLKSNYLNQIVSEIRADKQIFLNSYFENLSLKIEFHNIIFLNFSSADVYDYFWVENWTISVDLETTEVKGYLRFNGTTLRYSYGVCWVLFKNTYVPFILSITSFVNESIVSFYIIYETKSIAEVYNVHKYFLGD